MKNTFDKNAPIWGLPEEVKKRICSILKENGEEDTAYKVQYNGRILLSSLVYYLDIGEFVDMTGSEARFSMDFLADDETWFDGIDLGGSWNGAARPLFKKEVADNICKALNNYHSEQCLWYEPDKDCYIELDEDVPFYFHSVVLNGEVYYPIGTDCWVWFTED